MHQLRRAISVAAVAAVAGLMFAASAQLAGGSGSARQPQNLAEMVTAETDRVAALTEHLGELQAEVDELGSQAIADGSSDPAAEDSDLVFREEIAVGTIAVFGPGLTVTLDDAPASSANVPGVSADDLVIHQQDLQHVINALWAGGAEAMTLMGERVTMTSAFRCTGNVLLLHGRVFSPPFVVQAIGDPASLRASVLAAPGVQVFLGYVDWLGLGFSISEEAEITMPAYAGVGDLKHAATPSGIDPLRRG